MNLSNVAKCPHCAEKLDITDVVLNPDFKIAGVNFRQLLRLCVFYRTHNTDWPPKLEDINNENTEI